MSTSISLSFPAIYQLSCLLMSLLSALAAIVSFTVCLIGRIFPEAAPKILPNSYDASLLVLMVILDILCIFLKNSKSPFRTPEMPTTLYWPTNMHIFGPSHFQFSWHHSKKNHIIGTHPHEHSTLYI